MPRIAGDFAALLHAVASGDDFQAPELRTETSMTVIVAANGYPAAPAKGGQIDGLESAEEITGVTVFQAGTRSDGERLIADGGRVLAVTALGAGLGEARERAYRAVDRIQFADGFCRRDIGWRELERQA